jgi:hypothetical protein
MITQEQHTKVTPLDILIEQEDLNVSPDDRDALIAFMTETLLFILEQNTNRLDVVIWSILYELKDYTALQLSARQRMKDLKVSHGLIPVYQKKYRDYFNLK